MAVRWERVAWCAGCKWYLEPERAGEPCPSNTCPRKLRIRRGRICHECEDKRIFFDGWAFESHHRTEHGIDVFDDVAPLPRRST